MNKEINISKAEAALSMATLTECKSLFESFEAKQKAKDENGKA